METIITAAIVMVTGGCIFIFSALHLTERKRKVYDANKIICPHCNESVRNTSIVCKYCEKDL